ncbi:hypothetical protein BLOT_012982 [Blomia tropicalis]|nr:hypothetical protein BLOT_012982 [Blomia tropicalis]
MTYSSSHLKSSSFLIDDDDDDRCMMRTEMKLSSINSLHQFFRTPIHLFAIMIRKFWNVSSNEEISRKEMRRETIAIGTMSYCWAEYMLLGRLSSPLARSLVVNVSLSRLGLKLDVPVPIYLYPI